LEVFQKYFFNKEKFMKKIFVLILLIAVSAGAFALEKTVGGGALFNWSSTSGTAAGSVLGLPGSIDWSMNRTGFGAFGFFGISPYVEFNLGFLYKKPGQIKMNYMGDTETVDPSEMDIWSTGALQIGVYGKYPFVISDKIVIFPTAGIDFEYTISSDEAWWNELWFRGGAGIDFFLTERLFLRSHLIYGAAMPIGGGDWLDLKLTHGLLAKVGIGWMF
jgi:hypothetical protein